MTSSPDFLEFVDRSTKVIERALDEEYDVLADYTLAQVNDEDDDDGMITTSRGRLREVKQFWDTRWSKRRMVTSIEFSPKVVDNFDDNEFLLSVGADLLSEDRVVSRVTNFRPYQERDGST